MEPQLPVRWKEYCLLRQKRADEQLRLLDISSNNNLPSVLFEKMCCSKHSSKYHGLLKGKYSMAFPVFVTSLALEFELLSAFGTDKGVEVFLL